MINYERMINIKRTIDKAEKERFERKKLASTEIAKIMKLLKNHKKLTSEQIEELVERKQYYINLLAEEDVIYYNGSPLRTNDPDVSFILNNPLKVMFINEFDREIRKGLINSKKIKKFDKWFKSKTKTSIIEYIKSTI